jgi:hypothetical protein
LEQQLWHFAAMMNTNSNMQLSTQVHILLRCYRPQETYSSGTAVLPCFHAAMLQCSPVGTAAQAP